MELYLGYKDLKGNSKELDSKVSLHLFPFEKKYYRFIVFGDLVKKGLTLNASVYVEELIHSTTATISLNKKPSTSSINSDIHVCTNSDEVPVYVEVHNRSQHLLNTTLRIDLVGLLGHDVLEEIDYYGKLEDKNNYKVLTKPIEIKSQRELIVDLVPEGATYKSFLSYNRGSTLILLDDFTAIPYTKAYVETLLINNQEEADAITLEQPGFLSLEEADAILSMEEKDD